MLRTVLIASLMLAAGPAFAEMAAPAKPAKPPKQTTIKGCTASGYSGCHLVRVGKQNIMLLGKPDVVLPPAKTYVIATGVLGAAPPNVCNVTKQMLASKIIATRRACK
jgi:hypothetical protein